MLIFYELLVGHLLSSQVLYAWNIWEPSNENGTKIFYDRKRDVTTQRIDSQEEALYLNW